MSPAEAAAFLRRYNEWRRTDDRYGMPYPDPREIGEAIDAAVEMIERLEAAEKERDNANAAAAGVALKAQKLEEDRAIDTQRMAILVAELNGAERERDALRAENEALAANLRGKHSTTGATYAHLIEDRDALRAKIEQMEKQEPIGWFARIDGDGPLMECKHADLPRVPLYARVGAQAAPEAKP